MTVMNLRVSLFDDFINYITSNGVPKVWKEAVVVYYQRMFVEGPRFEHGSPGAGGGGIMLAGMNSALLHSLYPARFEW
jgi:hypothetical protein